MEVLQFDEKLDRGENSFYLCRYALPGLCGVSRLYIEDGDIRELELTFGDDDSIDPGRKCQRASFRSL